MRIEIKRKTPSINHLYGFKGYHKFLTKEGRELRELIHLDLISSVSREECEALVGKPLRADVEIHENWYTKKKKIAIKDVSNREKFLIDTIFKAIKLDDKQIWVHTMKKIQSNEEKAVIVIEEYKL